MSKPTKDDANLMIQLMRWGAAEGLQDAMNWIWSDEFISDYQQIKPIEDPIFWLSCGAFICLMSGLIPILISLIEATDLSSSLPAIISDLHISYTL